MSKRDSDGSMSKRKELREKRRRDEQRNRLIWIGLIVIGAIVVAFFLIYPQLKPVASIQSATPYPRPQVDRNSTGDPNAPIKLVEYSDFQCPFCKQFWQDTENEIIEAYVKTGKVLFTYRSASNWVSDNVNKYDNGSDVESQNSAMAAYCAADQNKFWELHDLLFTNVLGEADGTSFSDRRLQSLAQKLSLNMNDFNSCYSSQKYLAQVKKDGTDAVSAGIQGTPFFVITYTLDGQIQTVKLEGAQPFSVFQQEIDKALEVEGIK